MENAIIVGLVLLLLIPALRRSRKHMKGGCCGGSSVVHTKKTLEGPILGKKQMTVEGMHCENCQARVENALNRLDGVACTVNLRKKTATVTYSRPVTEEELREAVEERGYSVTAIRETK